MGDNRESSMNNEEQQFGEEVGLITHIKLNVLFGIGLEEPSK
jgi:hypothetical protein